jgi:hypothetical protein
MPEPTKAPSALSSFLKIAGAMVVVAAVIALVVRAGDAGRASLDPPGPPMTNVDVVSDPVGASVFDADGGLIGIAPLVISVPRSDKELVIFTRHEGYQERRSTVPLYSVSGRLDVELIKIGEKERQVKALPDGWTP